MSEIAFVRQGPFMLIQFNSSCDEALPVCQAMCCRMRKYYSVHLTAEESTRLDCHEQDGVFLLAGLENGDCAYLEGNRCSIYAERPKACAEWHCSPQGGLADPQITKREQGWVLFPAREAE